jgi:hypothetical protein
VASSAAVLAGAAASLVWAVRRRDRRLVGLGAVGLTGVAVAAVATASITDPGTHVFFVPEEALIYHLMWWPVGVLLTLGLVRSVVRMAEPWLERRVPRGLAARPAAATGALVAGLAAFTVVTAPDDAGDQPELDAFYAHEVVHAEAIAALPGDPRAVVLHIAPPWPEPPWEPEALDPTGVWALGPNRRYGYAANLVAQLRLHGIEVRFADEPDFGVVFMRAYREAHPAQGGEPVEVHLVVGPDAEREPPDGYRLVSRSPAVPLIAEPTAVLLVEDPEA